MIYKVLGALIIVAAGALAFLTLQDEDGPFKKDKKVAACVQLTPAQQLSQMINDDFQVLAQEGQLPPEWNSIATVEIRMNSELARAILGKQRPNIQRVKDGKNYLELEVMDLPDEENPGVIIQASLFDIKSKNKIFEIGRTYTMNELNKVAPPPQEKAPAKADATQQTAPAQAPSQRQANPATTQTPPSNAAPSATAQGATK